MHAYMVRMRKKSPLCSTGLREGLGLGTLLLVSPYTSTTGGGPCKYGHIHVKKQIYKFYEHLISNVLAIMSNV